MTATQYRIFVGFAFVAEILSVPLSFALPVELSFENGLIENAQIVVLIVGALWILKVRSPLKWFQRFFAAGLLLIVFRELSWGRVFFPVSMEPLGPVFIDMAHFKYGTEVHVAMVAYVAAMIFILIRFVPVKKILHSPQPSAAFAVMIVAFIFSSFGDSGLLLGKLHGQILEELNELIFYSTSPVAALYYCKAGTENFLR